MSEPIAICVVSHEPYLVNLNLILTVWDTFAPREWRRILSLDGCKFDNTKFPNWEVIENEKTGIATDARNAALDKLERGYVIFWDADNVPTRDYVEAVKEVTENNSETFCWYPEMYLPYEPYDIRFCNYIDTASVLRVETLKSIGGWNRVKCLQDWALHLNARSHGLKSEPLGASFVYCRHSESISSSYSPKEEIPRIRSLGIICPFRGDRTLTTSWLNSLRNQKFPCKVGITFIDKSGSESFSRWLRSQIPNLDFNRITYIIDEPVRDQSFHSIHNSVGKSYAKALQSTPEDLILTWEDDVTPVSEDAALKLIESIFPLSLYHVVGAQVPLRGNPEKLIAATDKERWLGPVFASENPLYEIGMVGGGFTLWHRRVLEEFGFQGMRYLDNFPLGWDGWLCHRINQKFKIGLAPVKCIHDR